MDREQILKAALEYRKMGFSVIPIKHDKKSYVKWERYQIERPDEKQIRQWWGKWPAAFIGIVTGEVSGVDVLDADSEKGRAAIEEFVGENFVTPISKTMKGFHYYFRHAPGLTTGTRVITDCDLRTTGGYAIAPPSTDGNGRTYKWLEGLGASEVSPSPMPSFLFETLREGSALSGARPDNNINRQNTYIKGVTEPAKNCLSQAVTPVTTRNIRFDEGHRDNSLFTVANALTKGGLTEDNIRIVLQEIGRKICEPPFPEKEIEAKIQSALKRAKNIDRNLAQEIRDILSVTSGNFSVTSCYFLSHAVTSQEKSAVRMALKRMADDGEIEPTGRRIGEYRKVEDDCPAEDFLCADENPTKLWLPLGLDDLSLIYPGDIIVFAGVKGSGKTTWLLNIAIANLDRFKTQYISSEIGKHAFRRRLLRFDKPIEDIAKKMPFRSRSANFQDVVLRGEGCLNIIDYMEVDADRTYMVGNYFREIHSKLNGAIAVIGLQMHPGKLVGMGAGFSLDKPNLYITLSELADRDAKNKIVNKARIHNVKEFPEDLGYHPQGRECLYQNQMGYRILKYPPAHWRGWVKPELPEKK